MSGPYRRGGGGAPRGPRPGRRATKAELEFNELVKAESEKPLRQYVQFLLKTLDASSGEPWNLFTLVMALNRFGKKSKETLDPASLTPLLEKFAERFTRNTEGGFDAQAVGNAFFGLQGLDTATLDPAGLAALTKVLTVLADKAGTCTEPLSAQAVGNAFYGLKGLDTATLDPAGRAALTKVLTVLADKAGTCTALDAKAVGNAFYGLKGFGTATLDPAGLAALTKVLTVLADKAGTCREPLSAQAVGNAFYGLKGLDTAALDPAGLAALTKVLTVLADKAGTCTEPLSAQQVGNAFYGLQGLDTATLDPAGLAALTKVLTVLADKAGTCTALDAQTVGNAFFGLRQFLATPATQSVANKIATHLVARMQTPALMQSNRANVARGLACALRCGHDARAALAASLDQVWAALETVLGNVEDGGAVTPIGLLALMESQQVYALYRRAIPAAIKQMFERHQTDCEEFLTARANEHRTEKAVCGHLQEILGVPVHMAGLHSGFELDLKLTYAEQFYNIELDGPHHQKLVHRLNDVQRDRFLDEAGVRVIRVPLTPSLGPKQLAQQVATEIRSRAAGA